MTKLSSLVLALGLLGVGACGGGDADKVKALADKMCACKDKDCIDAVNAEGKALGKEMQEKYKKKSDAPAELITELERGETCKRELRRKFESDNKAPAAATP